MIKIENVEVVGLEASIRGMRNPMNSWEKSDDTNIIDATDKYLREKKPELKSNRTKIKKKYTPTNTKIDYIYPPKWGINL